MLTVTLLIGFFKYVICSKQTCTLKIDDIGDAEWKSPYPHFWQGKEGKIENWREHTFKLSKVCDALIKKKLFIDIELKIDDKEK